MLVSSTAAVVYAWVRPLVSAPWALCAALLTLLVPALAYSDLIMTESAFLPVATLTLWLLARAIERPTRQRQLLVLVAMLLAFAIRMQGVVLLPVLVTAVGAGAWFGRDPRLLRRFVPLFGAMGVLVCLWLVIHVLVARVHLRWHGPGGDTAGQRPAGPAPLAEHRYADARDVGERT